MSDTVSMRHVAGELSISSTTVLRYLKSYQDDIKPQYIWLPEVICMDEIKSTRDAKGAMSFIFMDGIKHKFMDILDSRTIHDLEIYFKRYTKEARDSVKVIVTDINYTYPKLIKSVFKNAIVVTDRFHIVNLISKAFNRTRVRIMKKYASSNVKYKGLKRYWKLLLKPNEQLNFKAYYHYSFLQGLNTENSVVDRLLSYNDELKEAYEILQNVMSAIKYKDDERLDILLNDS
ncbi:transposase, partial [Levilactobacillus paucivorans]|uniref:transposase n=1 Tax=Levilactobacillus paucivorans TaxID=616990 RepID=UPI00138ECEB6